MHRTHFWELGSLFSVHKGIASEGRPTRWPLPHRGKQDQLGQQAATRSSVGLRDSLGIVGACVTWKLPFGQLAIE